MNAIVLTSPADHDLEQRIRSFLSGRSYPALQHLDIEVHHGAVIVSGNVDTFYEKQLATNCCQRVAGVLQVFNNVEVQMHCDHAQERSHRRPANRRLHRRK